MARKRAYDRAQRFLLELVSELEENKRGRLPSMARLAERADVSRRTLWQAAQELIASGVLGARPGYGLFVVRAPSPVRALRPTRSPVPRLAWQRVRDSLREDIQDGRYRNADALPSIKELCRTYEVSYPTMKRALASLREDNLVEARGARLKIAGIGLPITHQSVAFVTRQYPEEPQGHVPHRHTRDLLIVDNECRRMNLHLSHVRVDIVGGRLMVASDPDRVLSPAPAPGARPVLGFVIQPLTFADTFDEVWQQLVRTGKPVAVLRAHTMNLPFLARRKGPATAVMTTASSLDAGMAMGRYLLSRGHTRIAYLAYFSREDWVRLRLKGLRKAFADAGHPDAVAAYMCDMLDSSQASRITGEIPHEENTAKYLKAHQAEAIGPFEHAIWGELLERLPNSFNDAFIHQALLPLCVTALEKEETTAWVGANDETAIACLRFLESRRIPRSRISVAGFDDTIRSLQSALTTYDFGEDAAIHRALNHILQPY
ncbi:MAG: GntR family transcriptional regulator, partial [Chitinivibrionales bacterium]|nr:GntR family transcriptional regulator [Chitinivibrionales bacterium]